MEAKFYASQEEVQKSQYELHLQKNTFEKEQERFTREASILSRNIQTLTCELARERERHARDREEWERLASLRSREFTNALEEARRRDHELGKCEMLVRSSEIVERTLREGSLMAQRMKDASAAQTHAERQRQASEREAREALDQAQRAHEDRCVVLLFVVCCLSFTVVSAVGVCKLLV